MVKLNKLALIGIAVILFCSGVVAFATTHDPQSLRAIWVDEQQLRQELKELKSKLSGLKAQHEHIIQIQEKEQKELKTPGMTYYSPFPAKENPLFKVAPEVERKVYQTAVNYINGVTVTTSPILGLKSAWNASNLLYQVVSMNEDLTLLRDRDHFEKIVEALGSSLNVRPLLVLSGGVESTVLYTGSYTNSSTVDINVSTVRVDLWPILSPWAFGFISTAFDNSPPQTGSRVTNSRLFVQRAFLTIGNLQASPFYITMGQMYVPFGRYASAMVTAPLTLSMGRTEVRAALLGYYCRGLYAEVYGFRGNRIQTGKRVIFQEGANIGYKNTKLKIGALDIGAGYISNIADSQGMQNNGLFPGFHFPAIQFAGFGRTLMATLPPPSILELANNLKRSVGAVDVHMQYSKGIIAFITEYISATQHFNPGDLLINNCGALPKALHTELDFNFLFGHIPLTFGLAYGRTWDALPLNLPQQSFFAVISTSLWKSTVQSLEFRHDINYPYTPNTGGGGNGNRAAILPVPSANVGGTQNLVTLLVGVYF